MKRFLYKKHKFIYFIILVLIGMTLSFLSTYQFSFAIELSSTSIIDETFKEKFLSLSKSEQKIAYLTFDDGPTLKATPKILDILKEDQECMLVVSGDKHAYISKNFENNFQYFSHSFFVFGDVCFTICYFITPN